MTFHPYYSIWIKTTILGVAVTSAVSQMNVATAAPLIIPVTQSRTISASASADGEFGGPASDQDSDSAPDFGAFSSSVSARATSDGSGSATASQTSNILDAQITGVGAVDVDAVGTLAGTGSASALSSLSVAFQISQTVTYSFDGELLSDSSGFAPSFDGFIRLTGPGDNVVFLEELRFDNPTVSLITSGTLTPGEYVLDANVHASVGSCCGDGGTSSSASLDVDFNVIPEPTSGLLFVIGLPLLFATRQTWSWR